MKTNVWKLSALALLLMLSWSCRKEDPILPEPPKPGTLAGLYLLNEGSMSANNASLDYWDLYYTGKYDQDVYSRINSVGLGDSGNDLAVYGSKLYAVITGSNKVEIMQGNTVRIKKLDINQPRSIAFSGGKAYVTAWDGTSIDPNTSNGMVVEIDTAKMEITDTVLVGRAPEGLAVVGNRLYVANSATYGTSTSFDSTLSVINLSNFEVEDNIKVAINLKWVKPDADGNLYVSSLGDYYSDVPANLYVVNTQTKAVKSFDIPASNLCVAGDSVYVIGTDYTTYSYHLIDAKTQTEIPGGFIKAGSEASIKTPYGIAVDLRTKNVFVTDAGNYVSQGTLHVFNAAGQKYSDVIPTGVAPAHFAFVYW